MQWDFSKKGMVVLSFYLGNWENDFLFKRGWMAGVEGLHSTIPENQLNGNLGYFKSEYGFNCCIIYRIFRILLK